MSLALFEDRHSKTRYHDLRQFLDILRKAGQLHEVTAEVNPELELTEIYDRITKQEGPALLFRNVKGSEIPLVINLFGSKKRMELLLGEGGAEAVARKIRQLFDSKPPQNLLEKIQF